MTMLTAKQKSFFRDAFQTSKPPYRQTRLFHKPWSFSLHGVKLSHINKSHLYQELYGPRTLKYWNDHYDIPIPANCDIDWRASQAAATKLHLGLRRLKTKFSSGRIDVGSKQKYYKLQDHSTCPLCNAPSKKVLHAVHCRDPHVVQFAKTRIQETLKPKLTEMGTVCLSVCGSD